MEREDNHAHISCTSSSSEMLEHREEFNMEISRSSYRMPEDSTFDALDVLIKLAEAEGILPPEKSTEDSHGLSTSTPNNTHQPNS